MPSRIFDTGELPGNQQLDFWNDWVCDVFTQMDCAVSRGQRRFFGQLSAWELDAIQISHVKCEPCAVNHSRWHVSRATEEVYLVHLQLAGESLNQQSGREALLKPGDFTLCSSARPYSLDFDDNIEMMVIKIPKSVLQQYIIDPEPILGRHLDHQHHLNSAFVQHLQSLWGQQEHLDDELKLRAASNIVMNSLLMSVAELGGSALESRSSAMSGAHWQRIEAYIDRHLCDADLGPQAIAGACSVSERYLRQLFADRGISCSRHVLEQRLQRAAAGLKDPRNQHLGVSDMAYRVGFSNASHFSKKFREHFGLTAKQYRQRAIEEE